MILQRALLFVPGGRAELLEKAARFPADVLCLDLEESVLPEEKPRARELVAQAIAKLSQAGRTVQVRVNSIQSGETKPIRCGRAAGLTSVVEDASPQTRDIDAARKSWHEIAWHDRAAVAIESAQALLRCEQIVTPRGRRRSCSGAEDFTLIWAQRRARPRAGARRSVIATCARRGPVALDTPWADIEDIDGLVADAAREGPASPASVIHPTHIEPVQRVSAQRADIGRARAERAAQAGDGVQLDGRSTAHRQTRPPR
jgi:citrate lyase beta subunit